MHGVFAVDTERVLEELRIELGVPDGLHTLEAKYERLWGMARQAIRVESCTWWARSACPPTSRTRART